MSDLIKRDELFVQLRQIHEAIAKMDSLTEVKLSRDKASALTSLVTQQFPEDRELHNFAGQVKITHERRAGQLLQEMDLWGGDRRSESSSHRGRLKDLGINYNQSQRWQLMAKVSEDDYEGWLARKRTAENGEITTSAFLRFARKKFPPKPPAGSEPIPDGVELIEADCLDAIPELEDGTIDALITDPPYAVTENEWDQWESPEKYWEFMRAWLALIRPKMKEKFHAFIFCDADSTHLLCHSLLVTGWPILRQAIWFRPNLAKKRGDGSTFLSSYEPFWHTGSHALHFPARWGSERFDVQKFPVPQSTFQDDTSYHPTQKPLRLMRRLVSLASEPGELVVDPFVGSGTTALAAYQKGRRCIGIDSNERYLRIAEDRIRNAVSV